MEEHPSPHLDRPTVRDVGVHAPARGTPAKPLTLAGYEILGELGRGGMGVVYKARQLSLRRTVALKRLLADAARAPAMARFRREAEAVARLSHPNIVQIHEVGEHGGLPFFSMELCPGGSLDRKLAGSPLPATQAAALVRTLARAVHAAHQAGIVHRDLKPANVLLAEDGTPKVTDFGLAKWLDSESSRTQSGTIVGTPNYMAPEQAAGHSRAIGPRTDVWALGAILYECLTGTPPFAGESVWQTLDQVRFQEPVAVRRLQPKAPGDLETICLKCLHKDPARRYQSAADLADDLERFLEDEPVQARPAGLRERCVKWARRRPMTAALAGACTALALVVLAAIPWHISRLHAEVARSNARLRLEEEASRLARLRAECQTNLSKAAKWSGARSLPTAERREALEKTRARLFRVARLPDQDARADAELGRLRRQAQRQLAEVERRLELPDRAAQVEHLADEALFALARDEVSGPSSASPREAARLARAALAVFPDPKLAEPPLRARLEVRRAEVLLVLAEATARPRRQTLDQQRRRAREALAILQRVRGPGAPVQAVQRRRARYLALAGDSRADAAARRAAQVRPSTALDWFLAGHDRWRAGDSAGALDDFEQALAKQPDLFWAHFFRALAWQKLGNAGEARASLTVCINQRRDFVWLYLLRGFLAGQGGDFRSAEADFRSAEQCRPDVQARYVIHVNRGVLALRQRHADRAIAELSRAVALQPKRYHAHVNLAQAYRQRGDLAQAARALDRALALERQRASLYRTRARLRLERHDPQGALADLDWAVSLERDRRSPALARDHVERGLILYAAGRYTEAVRAAEEALRVRSDTRARRLHGAVLLKLRRYAEARAALDAVVAGKAQAEDFRRRGLARAALGDAEGALADYSRALALAKAPDARLRLARGWAYLVSAAPRPALRDFEAALTLLPGNADALTGRALARALLGLHSAAAADAEEALRRGPLTPRLAYNAARALAHAAAIPQPRLRARYRALALAALRRALGLLPAAERAGFWKDTVQRDAAFAELRRAPGFLRLAREHRRAPLSDPTTRQPKERTDASPVPRPPPKRPSEL
jgi:tetratricopeptide (TPR) repeat protein/tRNA A-37 threonylcarbamoyl transferase component Bud32